MLDRQTILALLATTAQAFAIAVPAQAQQLAKTTLCQTCVDDNNTQSSGLEPRAEGLRPSASRLP